MTPQTIECAGCDELFADYFEGGLDAARTVQLEEHASSCARCQGLIRDIDDIRAEAAVLPELIPSRDLWPGIDQRIQPSVVSIGARRERMELSRRIIGVAAAALIIVSSSITYVATRSIDAGPSQAAPRAGSAKPARSTAAAVPRKPSSGESVALPQSLDRSSDIPPKPVRRAAPGSGRGSQAALISRATVPMNPSELALAPEIERLQGMLRMRRKDLDTSTVRVVEENLELIDVALKQARAALERDPASGFLTEQLDNVLNKKVELLRTAALLPSRS
jgi:Putative zinc-finger